MAVDVFTALPFVSGSGGGGSSGSGIDPLLDRAFDIGEGFLNRVNDRKDARLVAQLEGRSLAAQQALLASLTTANAQAGTITPAAAPLGAGLSPSLLLLLGGGVLVALLARK